MDSVARFLGLLVVVSGTAVPATTAANQLDFTRSDSESFSLSVEFPNSDTKVFDVGFRGLGLGKLVEQKVSFSANYNDVHEITPAPYHASYDFANTVINASVVNGPKIFWTGFGQAFGGCGWPGGCPNPEYGSMPSFRNFSFDGSVNIANPVATSVQVRVDLDGGFSPVPSSMLDYEPVVRVPPFAAAGLNGTVTVENRFVSFTVSGETADVLREVATVANAAGAILSFTIAALMFATVGVTAGSLLAAAVTIGSIFSLVAQNDVVNTVTRGSEAAQAVTDKLTGYNLPAGLHGLAPASALATITSEVASRMASDPPRDDYLVPSFVPLADAFSGHDASTVAGWRANACMNEAVTALERYQGALLAGNDAAALARLSDYRKLEKCFTEAASIATIDLAALAASTGLIGALDTAALKLAFENANVGDLGPDTSDFSALADKLAISPEELLEQIKVLVSHAPDMVDPSAEIGKLGRGFDDAFATWEPIAGNVDTPGNTVPEPSTLAIALVALLCMAVGRKGALSRSLVRWGACTARTMPRA